MSAQDNIFLDIQLSYNQFTKTEKKIADYVLSECGKVLFMSITELADACQVAEASVHRFCRTMGARGYQEFKMKLSLNMPPDKETGSLQERLQDSQAVFMENILKYHLEAIQETSNLLDPEKVERIVDQMLQAKTIHFCGIGDSLLTAEEARNKFLRITPKVSLLTDPHLQAMAASMMGPEDMVFFISYSGATKDNVYVAEIAKEAGAHIVVITRFLKSPLTGYADDVLICGSNEGPLEGGSMGAKMSQLHIIDILFQMYYRKSQEVSRENNQKTSRAVADKLL